jgi:hypothetical protein
VRTSSAGITRLVNISWIFTVARQVWRLNLMEAATDSQNSKRMTRNEPCFSAPTGSRCCAFGTRNYGKIVKRFGTLYSVSCRSVRRMICRGTRDLWDRQEATEIMVERSPSSQPSPPRRRRHAPSVLWFTRDWIGVYAFNNPATRTLNSALIGRGEGRVRCGFPLSKLTSAPAPLPPRFAATGPPIPRVPDGP